MALNSAGCLPREEILAVDHHAALSTCSPAQRVTTWTCADSVTTVCLPTIEGMAFSTPRINSRGCRQPCICTGFLLAEPRPEFLFRPSLPEQTKRMPSDPALHPRERKARPAGGSRAAQFRLSSGGKKSSPRASGVGVSHLTRHFSSGWSCRKAAAASRARPAISLGVGRSATPSSRLTIKSRQSRPANCPASSAGRPASSPDA